MKVSFYSLFLEAITIPSKEHQQYIVKMIGSFDRQIESEEAYTIHLSKQKQYLLRQMFI